MKKLVTILFTLAIVFNAFSQMSLDDCIELALANNPDIQKSGFALQQSELTTKQAFSDLYPGVSASASTRNSGPFLSEMNDIWNQSIGGSVSQQFYRPGMYSNISLAKERTKSSEYSDEVLRRQIQSSIERLYYQILVSDTLVGVYKANILLSDEQIKKMQTMVDLGLKRESDLLKSKVQRGTFESQLISQLESLASSKRSLNIFMGQQPNAELDVLPVDVHVVTVPDYEIALAVMLEQNPTIKQYESSIKAQQLSLHISKEAYLPSVSGSYSASQDNFGLAGETSRNDNISLQLSVSLFDGFYKNISVQKSKIALEEAQLDYDAMLRDMEEALSNQYEALNTQNHLIVIHETNLASARKDLQVVSEQYASGLSSILDLTDSQVSVLESETNLLRDLYSRKQIESEIKRLIGN